MVTYNQAALNAALSKGQFGDTVNFNAEHSEKAKQLHVSQRKHLQNRDPSHTTVFDFIRSAGGFWAADEVGTVKHKLYYEPKDKAEGGQYEKEFTARDIANGFEFLEFIDQTEDLIEGLNLQDKEARFVCNLSTTLLLGKSKRVWSAVLESKKVKDICEKKDICEEEKLIKVFTAFH